MGLIPSLRSYWGRVLIAVVLSFLLLGGGAVRWLWLTGYWTDLDDQMDRQAGPSVMVATSYPGKPASAIEQTITNRIEWQVNQAAGVERVTSRSIAGLSMVRVEFRKDADAEDVLMQVRALANDARTALPPDTPPPVVIPFVSATWRPLGYVEISNPNMDEAKTADVAWTSVRTKLNKLPGVTAPIVLGGKDRVLYIRLDPDKLQARRLSSLDVVKTPRERKMIVSPGFEFSDGKILLDRAPPSSHTVDLSNDPFASGNLLIQNKPGSKVFLRDIGHAEYGYAPRRAAVFINGRRSVCLPFYRSVTSTRAAELRETVRHALPDLETGLLADTHLNPWMLKMGRMGRSLLTIHLRAPSHLRLKAVETCVAEVEKFLEENIPAEDRVFLISEIGMDPTNFTLGNVGEQDATIRVQLADGARTSAQEYAAKLLSSFTEENRFANLRGHFLPGHYRPIDIRIEGDNLVKALSYARAIRNQVRSISGVADTWVVQRIDLPYLVIDVDCRKAVEVGLKPPEVILQALAALGPTTAIGPFELDLQAELKSSSQFSVRMPMPTLSVSNWENLLNVSASGTKENQLVNLSRLVSFRRTYETVEIDHDNLARVMDVRVHVQERDRAAMIRDIQAALKRSPIPAGMKMEVLPEAPLWP